MGLTRGRRQALLAGLAGVLASDLARAASDTATFNADGSWSQSESWTHSNPAAGGLIPNNGTGGFTFDVVIPDNAVTLDIPGGVTLDSLRFTGFSLVNNSTITLVNAGTWGSGVISGVGTVIVGPTATFKFIDGIMGLQTGQKIINNGTIDYALTFGASKTVNLFGDTRIVNNGTFIYTDNGALNNSGSGINSLMNNGLLAKIAGTGTSLMNAETTNAGTVSVSTGTLQMHLREGATSSGTFIIGSPAVLRVGTSAESHLFSLTSSVTGAGSFAVGGETIVIGGAYNVTGRTILLTSATLRLEAGTGRVLRTSRIQLDGGTNNWHSRVDLTDGSAIIDYTGSSTYATIQNQIRYAFTAGELDDLGITSSMADELHALGYAEASAIFSAFPASFAGQPVDSTSVLIDYTYRGDTNLDGKVDATDLGNLAFNWQTAGEWIDGDFDYNGLVNVNDLDLLAKNWGAGIESSLVPSLNESLASLGLPHVTVPEPTGSILVGAATWSLARPRRRCRNTGEL